MTTIPSFQAYLSMTRTDRREWRRKFARTPQSKFYVICRGCGVPRREVSCYLQPCPVCSGAYAEAFAAKQIAPIKEG